MAIFDESKVINALHIERAELGKKYWFTDGLASLKRKVEKDDTDKLFDLDRIDLDRENSPFIGVMLIGNFSTLMKNHRRN